MNKFLWMLRRELWESRVVWMAPAICGGIMIIGTLLGVLKTGNVQLDADFLAKLHSEVTPEKARGLASVLLMGMSVPFLITVLFSQTFYTLDALYSERRDRSILFWRSLPVSDTVTVLSKVVVGALLIPGAAAVAAFGTELVLVGIATAKSGSAVPMMSYLWSPSVWGAWGVALVYLTLASALWYLPAVGWNLLVSAWAPRSPLIYAALAPLAVGLAEKVTFGTHTFLHAIGHFYLGFAHRVVGPPGGSLTMDFGDESMNLPSTAFDIIHPIDFLATPELWVYVAIGAGMIAAAVWMRRYRENAA
jgi:ABC-2 type transport system permease protein